MKAKTIRGKKGRTAGPFKRIQELISLRGGKEIDSFLLGGGKQIFGNEPRFHGVNTGEEKKTPLARKSGPCSPHNEKKKEKKPGRFWGRRGGQMMDLGGEGF